MQASALKQKLKKHSYARLRGICRECDCYAFASGLCTRHYRIQWTLKRYGPPKVNNPLEKLKKELTTIDEVLADYRSVRDRVTGTATRLFWRAHIRHAEIERRRILQEIARAST